MSTLSFKQALGILCIATVMVCSSTYATYNVTGTISTNTTWGLTSPATDGIYIITGDVTVTSGATLTIEAGVTVKSNQNYGLFIGGTSSEFGTLLCQGTETSGVLFTANTATPSRGWWKGLYFRINSDASQISYTTIEWAGYSNSANVLLESSDADFDHVLIKKGNAYGMYLTGNSAPTLTYTECQDNSSYGYYFTGTSAPSLALSKAHLNASHGIYATTTGVVELVDCQITNNTSYGIYCSAVTVPISIETTTFSSNATPLRLGVNRIGFCSGNTYTANTNQYIDCIGGTVDLDAYWEDPLIPYHILGDVTITGKDGSDNVTKVTIQAGNDFLIEPNYGFYVGHDTDPNLPGALTADASAGQAITFNRNGTTGNWWGIKFANFSLDSGCIMKNCTLTNSGNTSYAAIFCNYANPTLQNVRINGGPLYGIYCNYSSPSITACEVYNMANVGIWLDYSSPTIANSYIHNNTSYGITVRYAMSNPTITANTIQSNSNYGIYLYSSCTPTVSNNLVTLNTATYSMHTYGTQISKFSNNTCDKDIYVNAENIGNDTIWAPQLSSVSGYVAYYMTSGFSVQGLSGPDGVTTLTLQAGTSLKFPASGELFIGHDSDPLYPGGLLTEGTNTNPVKLTCTAVPPVLGSWSGVYFAKFADSTQCVLNYTTIEYAGYYWTSPGTYHYPIYANYSSPRLYRCTISNAQYYGVYAIGGNPIIDTCTIGTTTWNSIYFNTCNGEIVNNTIFGAAAGQAAIYLNNACNTVITGNSIQNASTYGIYCNTAQTAPIINSNVFTGNSVYPIYIYARNVWKIGTPLNLYQYSGSGMYNRIYVVGDTINLDSTWVNQNKPYFISGNVTVTGIDGADSVTTLTIQPGAELQFTSATGINIGSNDAAQPGALVAIGTSSQRIVFTGSTQTVGYWRGLYFYNYASDTITNLQYCDIKYAGYDVYEPIHCEISGPTLRNCRILYGAGSNVYSYNGGYPKLYDCEIAYCNTYGVLVSTNSNILLSTCNIHHNASYGIYLTTNALCTVEQNSTIADNTNHGVYVYAGSNATIRDTLITRNNYGVYCNATADIATITNCVFSYNNNYPIYMYASRVGNVTNCTFTSNLYQYFVVVGETLALDSTWKAMIPYRIASADLVVQGKDGADSVTTLTLEPGVELRFDSQRQLIIGHDTSADFPGGLIALGTETNPIKLTAHTDFPTPSYWDGIYFSKFSVASKCTLEYTTIQYGGYAGANVFCNIASPTMRNCKFLYGGSANVYAYGVCTPIIDGCEIAYSTGHGLQFNTSPEPVVTNCNIHDNTSYGIYVYNTSAINVSGTTITRNSYGIYCSAVTDRAVISSCTFDNNVNYPIRLYARWVSNITSCTYTGAKVLPKIYVVGDTISKDSYWESGAPYYVTGNLFVQGNDGSDSVTTLSLAPGVIFRFAAQIGIQIGDPSDVNLPGGLRAIGTATQHITFTSDNTYPAPGDWRNVYYASYASDANCRMKYCDILYGGYSGYGSVYCVTSAPIFENTTFRFGASYNIYVATSAAPSFTDCEISYSNGPGLYLGATSIANINDSNIHHNAGNGIYVVGNSTLYIYDSSIDYNNFGINCSAAADTAVISGCTFDHNTNYPINAFASKIGMITTCTFTNNQYQFIRVQPNTIVFDSTWQNHGVPYYIDSTGFIYIQGQNGPDNVTSLTLNPGVIVQFYRSGFYVGNNSVATQPGAIIINGTAANPVLLTSRLAVPVAADWNGIWFADFASDTISSVNNCIIEYHGYSDGSYQYGAIDCYESSPNVTNTEMRYGVTGVYARTNYSNPTINNCWIHDNQYGVYAAPGNAIVNGGIVENNTSRGIHINEAIADYPSSIINGVLIQNNTCGYGIYVDGASSTPLIKNCIIKQNNSSLTGYGVYVTGSALPIIGASSRAGSGGNDFSGHYSYAVYNATTTTCVMAQYNYWGVSGGPYDASAVADGCINIGNNNPLAERVSDDVDYRNWSNGAFTPTPIGSPTPTPEPSPTLPPCVHDGDVNNDGNLTIGDSQMIYMIVLGFYTPDYEESCSADCNAVGGISMADAQCIYMNFLGLDCDCDDPLAKALPYVNIESEKEVLSVEPKETTSKNIVAADIIDASLDTVLESVAAGDLIYVEDTYALTSDMIEVNIRISNPNTALDAFGFSLHFDSEMLEYVDIIHNDPDREWVLFGAHEANPGEIRVTGFVNPADAIPTNSNELFLTLEFKVTCDGCNPGDHSELNFTNLTDDLAGWTGVSGRFTYRSTDTIQPVSYLEGRMLWVPESEHQNYPLQ